MLNVLAHLWNYVARSKYLCESITLIYLARLLLRNSTGSSTMDVHKEGRFGQMWTPVGKGWGKGPCIRLQASTVWLFQYVLWTLSMGDA